MAKKDKKARKRAARRERAKFREGDQTPEEELEAQEAAADEAVAEADAAAPPPPPSRERRPAKPIKEESRDTPWSRGIDFLREVDIERKKINWPAVDETWRSTWVVVFTILFLAGFTGLCSFGFQRVSEQLFRVPQAGIQQPAAPVPITPLGGVGFDPGQAPAAGGGGEGGTAEMPEGE